MKCPHCDNEVPEETPRAIELKVEGKVSAEAIRDALIRLQRQRGLIGLA